LWGLVALASALFFLWQQDSNRNEQPSLYLPAAMFIVYAISYHFLPPLLISALALISIGCTLSTLRLARRFHFGLIGLLLLALPVIPTLQFYLGYPLRVLVATLALPILRLNGIMVVRDGSCLSWGGTLISIDAPCSGIKMLWTGLYLAFALCCCYRLNNVKTAALAVMAVILVIFGNTLRAVSLFYIESGIIKMPGWTHEGVGLLLFAITALAISALIYYVNKRSQCAPSTVS
jgi:exosortase